jgi:cytochrome c-type biogenesis protein CcmH
MTLWFLLAIMTAAALAALAWPLVRGKMPVFAGDDVAVYRDQLEEIERDRADGRIGHDEFEAARVEVSRRLLAAASAAASTSVAPSPRHRLRIRTLAGAAIAIPLIAIPFYARLGSPGLPGEPLASRNVDPGSIGVLIARIERHLEEHPNDGRGWEVIAPVYMRLGRFDDAVRARRNALKLLGTTARREVDLGGALALAAGSVVTAESKAAFERAAALEPGNAEALFFLGMAAQQDGNTAEAARIWGDLVTKAPPDAPWLPMVRDHLASIAPQFTTQSVPPPASAPPSIPGPTPQDMAAAEAMTPEARDGFIRGMVERLASRLRDNGSDVEGWLRLLRAYKALGERDKAKNAASAARQALAGEPEKLKLLDVGLQDPALQELDLQGQDLKRLGAGQ